MCTSVIYSFVYSFIALKISLNQKKIHIHHLEFMVSPTFFKKILRFLFHLAK